LTVKILLDTNILIDALAGHPGALAEITSTSDPAISVISAFEVLAGAPSWDQAKAQTFLARFRQIDVDPDIALLASSLAQERKLPMPDALIVATAQATGRTLISRDVKLCNQNDDPPVLIPYTV
jgi:predicted nucleic acid-binding protein